MKTLRRNRLFLGWCMTLLVATLQIATPLRAATVYWSVGTSRTIGGTWNLTSSNWTTVVPNGTPSGNTVWDNTNALPDAAYDVAGFGSRGSSTSFTVSVADGVTINANGLNFESNSGTLITSAGLVGATNPGTLNLAGTNPTITLGYSTAAANTTANMNVRMTGSNGMIVRASSPSPYTGRLVLGEPGAGSNHANDLTGGITVQDRTTLEAVVRTGNNNPLGTNAITLQGGASLDLTGTRNSAVGISGRLFNVTTGTSNTGRFDYTGTATGETLPGLSFLASGSGGQDLVTISNTSLVSVGQAVTGSGIAADTTISQIVNGTQVRLSQNLNSAVSTITVTPDLAASSLPLSPAFTVGSLDGAAASTSIRYVDAAGATQTVSNYAVQYVGKVQINTAGGYSFFASPDDGARVFVDGILVLNNDGGKGATDLSSALVQLGAGYHDIRVDYIQGTGGGSLNLGYSGPDTSWLRNSLAAVLYQAETNTAAGSSNAIALNNDVRLTGNAAINLKGNLTSSIQLGGLQLETGRTLTVKAVDGSGIEVAGGGNGFGQTLRFAGTTVFGDSTGGAGTVTINANPNVAFDGVVSDGNRAMTILKTGLGHLFFNQTSVANDLGSSTQIKVQGLNSRLTSTTTSGSSSVTVSSASGLTPGMTVTGTGIPDGAFIVAISGNTLTLSSKATSSGTPLLNVSATPTLVLTGSTSAGAFNPIGSASIHLNNSNLVLDSKGATSTGVGPLFANNVLVTGDAAIQSVVNAATTLLGAPGNTITIASQTLSSTTSTSGTGKVVTVSSTANLRVGQVVSGTGVPGNTTIASIDSPTQYTLSNAATLSATNNLTYGTTLVLDAISGGLPTSDPGATLAVVSGINGDATTTLTIRSSLMNAGVTLIAAEASVLQSPQTTGNAGVSRGVVALRGDNTGFLGTLSFEANAGLRIESVNALNGRTFALNNANTLFLLEDGDGTGKRETFDFNHHITINNNNTLAVGRVGTTRGSYFTQAANKTLQISTLATGRVTVIVANNNGYGLEVTDSTTLNGAPTFQVNSSTVSTAVQGLVLSGVVSGNVSIGKTGAGTLVLGNPGNTFGGNSTLLNTDIYGKSGSAVITASNISALISGQRVSGTNLPSGAFINSLNVQNFGATGASGVTTLSLSVDPATVFEVGMPVTGAGIRAGTKILSFNNNVPTDITGSIGSNVITVTGGAAGFRVGDPVFGTGIPTGTEVIGVNGSQLTLSQNVTSSSPTLFRRQVTLSLTTTSDDPTLVLQQITLNTNLTGVPGTITAKPMINIAGGIVEVAVDSALGNPANQIMLNANAATGVGLRATGTFTTSRAIILNQANNAIEVTKGNTLTLQDTGADSGLWVVTNTNNLQKNDIGTLVLTAAPEGGTGSSATWNGTLSVGQGTLQINNAAAFGASGSNNAALRTIIGDMSAEVALNLSGSNTINETFQLNTQGNRSVSGIDSRGSIRNIAGTNTITAPIILAGSPGDNTSRNAIVAGVEGGTLNLAGGVRYLWDAGGSGRSMTFYLTGSGTGTLSAPFANLSNNPATATFQKVGSGTWNVTASNGFKSVYDASTTVDSTTVTVGSTSGFFVGMAIGGNPNIPAGSTVTAILNDTQVSISSNATANASNVATTFGSSTAGIGAVNISSGTLALLGNGIVNGTGTVSVLPGATLNLNNVATNVTNRLSGGSLTVYGASVNVLGNASSAVFEQTGTFTVGNGHSVLTLVPDVAQSLNLTLGTSTSVARSGGGTVLFRGTNLGNAAAANTAVISGPAAANGLTFIGQVGATGATNKSIVPWALVDNSTVGLGLSFATADSASSVTTTGTNRLRALSAGEFSTGIVSLANIYLSSAASVTTNTTVNSLTLNNGGGITTTPTYSLAIESGGILAFGGNTGISGGLLTTVSNRELIVHALGNLNITSAVVGVTAGLTKSGAGTLTLGTGNTYTGITTVNQGTLRLATGSVNSIYFNNDLVVNAGGTLDLNGSIYYASRLRNDGNVFVAGNGGLVVNTRATGSINVLNAATSSSTVTLAAAAPSDLVVGSVFLGQIVTAFNTGRTIITLSGNANQSISSSTAVSYSSLADQATLVLANGGANWSGQINGGISVAKAMVGAGSNDWNVYDVQGYTGATILTGGRTQLLDSGALPNTSSIAISHANLLVQNGANLGVNLNNRVNDSASVSLFGGMLQYRNRHGDSSSETFGTLTIGGGQNILDVAVNGVNVNSADVTFTSLSQAVGSRATMLFRNMNGQIGSNARVFFTSAPTMANNLIANAAGQTGWAIIDREFASYAVETGVAALNAVGYAGYAPNPNNTINTGGATDNIRLTLSAILSTASAGTNLITVSSTSGLQVGQTITGTGIAPGTTITQITNGTQFLISSNLTGANPTIAVSETLAANRTINTLNLSTTRGATLDLGGKTLTLAGGGIIASQTSDNTANVVILSSSLTSNQVVVQEVTADLVVGSILNIANGRTVTAINGNVITLASNPDLAINTPTTRSFVSANPSLLSIINGNLTSGTTSAPSDLYFHALPYGAGPTNGRVQRLAANIVDNAAGGSVSLVLGGNIAGAAQGGARLGVSLSGSNTYTGGTFINSGTWYLANPNANGTSIYAIPGNITITGGINEENNTYGGIVIFDGSSQIKNTAIMTLKGGASVDLNDYNQTLGGLVIDNTGGSAPTLDFGAGTLTLNGNITATASSVGNVSVIQSGNINYSSSTTNGSPVITVASTDGLIVGAAISGTGIPSNSTITAILDSSRFVISSNATVTGTNSLTYANLGRLDLNGATRTFNVGSILVNGLSVAPLQATLNISAPIIQGVGAAGIIKSGAGLLQLGGQSTFTGGVNVTGGGLIIGSSSIGSAVGSVVTSGPVGTGTLTLVGGSTLISTAATNTLGNAIVSSGNLRFDGVNNLTLNGDATLAASATITVALPTMTATFGGKVTGSHTFDKNGLGVLAFSNAYLPSGVLNSSTMSGTMNVNEGTLRLVGPVGAANATPLGSMAIVLKGGLLELRSNGSSSYGAILYGNNVTVDSAQASAIISVDRAVASPANTNNTFQMGTLTIAAGKTLTVASANNYNLRFTGGSYSGTGTISFAPSAGSTLTVGGGFTDTLGYANTGAGTLLLGGSNTKSTGTTITTAASIGAAPTVNSVVTPFGTGQSVTLSNGVVFPIIPIGGMPQQGTILPGDTPSGYTQGGLTLSYYSGGASNLNSPFGSGMTAGAVLTGQLPGDSNFNNRPALVTSLGGTQAVYSGLIRITNAGDYTFQMAAKQGMLIIDGVPVAGLNVDASSGGGSMALAAAGTGSINLSAGYHSIVIKLNNTTGSGGLQLLYGGPDTTGNGLPVGLNNITAPASNLQAIPSTALYWTTNSASATNAYNSAAQINNNFIVAASASVTLDGAGTDINSTLASLNLANNSTLNVSNQLGTGWIGVLGTTTVGSGATVAPGSGRLYLIGGVNDGGNGLTKSGNGTLILGAGGSFTGAVTVNQGFLQITAANSLPTGGVLVTRTVQPSMTLSSTTVNNNNTVTVADTSSLKVGMGVSGTGIASGAFISSIVNGTTYSLSSNATTGATNTLTYDPSRLTISGTPAQNSQTVTVATTANLAVGMAVSGGIIQPGSYITAITGPTTFTVSQVTQNTGTSTVNLVFNTDTYGAMDLNGIANVVGNITLNGVSPIYRNSTTPAALFNSSATLASVTGNVSIGAAALPMATSIGGFGDITLNGVVQDGGTAAVAWSKVGSNTLTVNGNNTFTGALTVSNGIFKLGHANGLGSTAGGTAVNSGATLDVNGQLVTANEALTLNGAGVTGLPQANTLGALVNSSASAASYAGTVNLATASSIGGVGNLTLSGIVTGTTLLTKNGTGILTLTGANTTTGGMTINAGAVVVSGASGVIGNGGNTTINPGAALSLNNSTATGGNLNNRLAGRGVTINGSFNIVGGATNTQELISASGQTLTFANSASVITLTPDAGGSLLLNITSNTALSRSAGATALFRGTGLGTQALTSLATLPNNNAGFGVGTQANPGFVGQNSGQGRGILPWALVDTSATGTGTGFAAYDTTNGFRSLSSMSSSTDYATTLISNANVITTTALTAGAGTLLINSLTLQTGGSLTIGAGNTLQLDSGGVLSTSTSNTSISGAGVLTFGNTFNREMVVHVVGSGSLTINPTIYGVAGAGLTKAGTGVLILGASERYLGNTVINGGTLRLAGGAQTIFSPFTTGPSAGSLTSSISGQVLQVNGGGGHWICLATTSQSPI